MSRSMLLSFMSAATLTALAAALPVGAGAADGAPGGAGSGTSGPTPALSATVEQCVTAPTQADRSATFAGQMETVAGATRMAIQIEVQEHVGGEEGFHTLTSAGLGSWQRSEAGVKIYKVRQAVTDLPAPAVYRAIVLFRWLNEKGHVIKHDQRRTTICRQPAPTYQTAPGSAPSRGAGHEGGLRPAR
jgi:hypothetical protein